MNAILDYLLHRPVSACIQGVIMGLKFPLAMASLFGNKVGGV